MKKLITIAASALLAISILSCGKKIDTSVWLTNFDDAKKAAQAENKRIFLFFSEDEGDGNSATLKQNIFNKEEFISDHTKNYVLVNIDYSNIDVDSEDKNIKRDLRLYELFDVQGTPAFMLLSSDGYVLSKIAFDKNADLDTARITFSEAEEEIQNIEDLIAKTKTGTTEERLVAINSVYDLTEPSLSYHLAPLSELYLSLDKDNASGDSLRHLIALAYKKATDFFLEDEVEKAAEEFAKMTKNKILTDDDKQMAYYTAGYLLASGGSENFEKIKEYFQKAYDIAPDSDMGQNIKMSLNYVQMLIDGEGDAAPSYDVPTAPAEDEPLAENPQN